MRAGVAAAALALACVGCRGPLNAAGARPVTLLTWNTFNLFDAEHDGTEYREYDPGRGRWNASLYERKLAAVATVIRRACPGGPDILALQELENAAVLDALCDRHLRGYRWRAVPAGGGGVRCGVASRLPIRRAGTLDCGEWAGEGLRPALEVEVDCRGAPLVLLVVHWKSKVEGAGVTQPGRDAAARAVARRLRALLAGEPGRDVVLAGDLNEGMEELAAAARGRPLVGVDSPARTGVQGGRVALFDAWNELPPSARGSAAYRGAWQTPDHLLLSAGLFDASGLAYRKGSFAAVRHSFMLDPRTGLPLGDRALVWRYSDHLPLLAVLDRMPARR